MKFNKIAIALAALAIASQGASALELPDQIGDHAVLQQKSNAKLWGWAAPGAKVTATPSWSGKKSTAIAGEDGRWVLTVATPAASYTPYTIKFTEGKESKTISDILVGEVWVAAGQSNMEMPVKGFWGQPVHESAEALAHSTELRDKVRMAYTVRDDKEQPAPRVPGAWKVASPENTPDFSAQGFFFARELNRLIDVPVGILCMAYGGTQVEGWMPRDLLDKLGFGERPENVPQEVFPAYLYSTKYNAMIYPLKDYTIRGFLWNQGESNIINSQQYAWLLSEMVKRWREDWGDTENALPFYQTENPHFGWGNAEGLEAALVREQQYKAYKMIPNSGLTATNDLIFPFERDVIHGSLKRPIGERMAWEVAEKQYGFKGMPWRALEFAGIKKDENGNTRVMFTNTFGALTPNVGNVEGFEVAGEDGKYHKANAVVDWFADNVILTCPEVADIKNVRYCFKNSQVGTLRNCYGMPAFPFRTDK